MQQRNTKVSQATDQRPKTSTTDVEEIHMMLREEVKKYRAQERRMEIKIFTAFEDREFGDLEENMNRTLEERIPRMTTAEIISKYPTARMSIKILIDNIGEEMETRIQKYI